MKILYLDPVLGISGDKTVSALIDAGCPLAVLTDLLGKLPVKLPSLATETKRHGALVGTYLKTGPSDLHFSVREMEEMIAGLDTEERVRNDARGMLDVVVAAESKVHGVPKEEIHFHELSHIDTLIDLLCVARAVAYFSIDKVFCGPVPHGRGFIKTAHGIMPNPPPATTELLTGFPAVFIDEERELTTPTGAAIVRYYVKAGAKAPFILGSHGCGFGTFETTRANVLRVFIGESTETFGDETVWMMEADMDDMEMEYMAAAADRIRRAGALDVLYFPVQMKKGRVGMRLSVIAPEPLIGDLTEAIFRETSTFGIRLRSEWRSVLAREEGTQPTRFGPIKVKKGFDRSGKLMKTHIEFEEVKRIADEQGIPYRVLLEDLKKEL